MSTVWKTIAGFRDRTCGWSLNRQRWMRQYVCAFRLLLLSQAACLALGLWIECQLVNSLDAVKSETALDVPTPDENSHAVADSNVARTFDVSAAAMKIMGFLWIAALQAAAAYLVLSGVFTEAARTQLAATGESLKRQKDLLRTRDAVIFGLAKLAESRDPETGNHLERIVLYSTRLAAALQRHPSYRSDVTSTFVKLIGISAALHDIGKVGVRDSVLLKPERLNRSERASMELHAEIGGKCIRDIEVRLGSSNFLQMASQIALSHHERWDGTGYPKGLSGNDIPLAARIVAVCDVYDALSARRIYKSRLPHEQCIQLIRDGAGSHFDPEIVEAFLKIHSEFREIASRYAVPAAKQETCETDLASEEPEVFVPVTDTELIPAYSAELLPS